MQIIITNPEFCQNKTILAISLKFYWRATVSQSWHNVKNLPCVIFAYFLSLLQDLVNISLIFNMIFNRCFPLLSTVWSTSFVTDFTAD